MTRPRPRSIGLVDLSATFKACYHSGAPESGGQRTIDAVLALRASAECVVLCLDAPPYERKRLFADYKANRTDPEPVEVQQRRWVYERCKALGFQMAKVEGYEGDDVIATLARIYAEWCPEVLMIGSDKDLAACVTETVSQFVPARGDKPMEIRGPKEVYQKFGVFPEQIPLFLALCGDKSDNIPGVKDIGQVKASGLAHEFKTLQKLKDGLVYRNSPNVTPRVWKLLEAGWDQLQVSLTLTTLNDKLPIDAEALLIPVPAPAPIIGKDPNADQFLVDFAERIQERDFDAALSEYVEREEPSMNVGPTKMTQVLHEIATKPRPVESTPTEPANEGGKRVEEPQSKVTEATFEEVPKPKEEPKPAGTALVKAPTDYGLVTADLQPIDLRAARNLAAYLFDGKMYAKKFETSLAIFTVILRARELGIGITTALANMHNVDGQIVMSADLIRAQCEKSPDFEYLMPIEMGPTRCVWEGKNKRHPKPIQFSYTLDEAKQAGLLGRAIWRSRPQDMLNKTAGSKLARILFPACVAGIYCPEEMEKEVGVAA